MTGSHSNGLAHFPLNDGYIIEDDYVSEFRFHAHPMPSIRISCTVFAFDQYTLERFLSRGYFEKHINRMCRFYKTRRDGVMDILKSCEWAQNAVICEENAGLHFLLKVDTDFSDDDLVMQFEKVGIRVRTLSSYYDGSVPPEKRKTLVINYSGLKEEELERLKEVKL